MNMYDDLFDSESEDSDDEIISKMAYPVTINNTVKWSHTQNVTPVPSQQNRSLHQTKVPSMIGRACTKLVVKCGCKIGTTCSGAVFLTKNLDQIRKFLFVTCNRIKLVSFTPTEKAMCLSLPSRFWFGRVW